MRKKLIKIIGSLGIQSDLPFVDKMVNSFDLSHDACLFIFALRSDKCLYFDTSITKILGHTHRKYVNKGYIFFKSIIHPADFPTFIEEVLTLIRQSDHKKENIYAGNLSGFPLKFRNKKGDWIDSTVYLIYLKESKKYDDSLLIGFIRFNEYLPPEYQSVITSREIEVFRYLASGNSSKMIADKLCISENTVITHRKHLIQKLKVKNSAELIKMGYVLNILF